MNLDKKRKKELSREAQASPFNFAVELKGRGEDLMYREGDRVGYAEVTHADGFRIYRDSLSWRYPVQVPMSESEKDKILNNIVYWFRIRQEIELIVE